MGVGNLHTLAQVKRAKEYISECALSAAERRYPRLHQMPEEKRLRTIHETAKDRWPGFDDLTREVAEAERAAILKAGAMA